MQNVKRGELGSLMAGVLIKGFSSSAIIKDEPLADIKRFFKDSHFTCRVTDILRKVYDMLIGLDLQLENDEVPENFVVKNETGNFDVDIVLSKFCKREGDVIHNIAPGWFGGKVNEMTVFVEQNELWLTYQYAALFDKHYKEFLEPYFVNVDYDSPNAIIQILKENGFSGRSLELSIPLEQIPIVGSGQVVQRIHEIREPRHSVVVHENTIRDILLSHEVRQDYYEAGLKFCDPLTAINYVVKNMPYDTFFTAIFNDVEGRPSFMNFYTCGRDIKGLRIANLDPSNIGFDSSTIFLTVKA